MPFPNVDLFNSDYIKIIPDGRVEIIEKKTDGAGVCYFDAQAPVLLIKAKDQAPIVWSLKNSKCAEGAFLIKRNDLSLELHIVEMKSGLTLKDFLKVIQQWRGMYLSALAVIGIIKSSLPVKVVAYVAYKQDKINYVDATQPIMLKTQVGGALMPGKKEWSDERVILEHGVVAQIVKKQRSGSDCDFGVV